MDESASQDDAAEDSGRLRMPVLSFWFLEQSIQIRCFDEVIVRALEANFGAHAAHTPASANLEYEVTRYGQGWRLRRNAAPEAQAPDLGELLFLLEKDICIWLQERRAQLFFLHAAWLERDGKAYLLAGDSGHGKSTTAWGLLHHGFRYGSDELSPVDLSSLSVFSYSHALCLKRPPPPPFPFPTGGVMNLGRTLHVPVPLLPGPLAPSSSSVAAILFVRHRPGTRLPALRMLSVAEAAVRVYVSALNALSHPSHGVDSALRLARYVPSWSIETGELSSTCEMIDALLRNL